MEHLGWGGEGSKSSHFFPTWYGVACLPNKWSLSHKYRDSLKKVDGKIVAKSTAQLQFILQTCQRRQTHWCRWGTAVRDAATCILIGFEAHSTEASSCLVQ